MSLSGIDTVEFYMSRTQIDAPAIHAAWKTALSTGDLRTTYILQFERLGNFNIPADQSGLPPITTLLNEDKDSYAHLDQEALAEILISNGAELCLPDKCGMLPADHAMLSRNREAALTVVRATIQRMHENNFEEYVPDIEPFFAINPNMDIRIEKYEQFLRNHAFIGLRLIRDCFNVPARGFKSHLSDEQFQYWANPPTPTFEELPDCTIDMIEAIRRHRRENTDKSEEFLNITTIARARQFQRERWHNAMELNLRGLTVPQAEPPLSP